MFKRNLMSRRQVLGSALGGLLLSPFLRARRLEAQALAPRRLILAFTPDSHPPEWWPSGTGRNFTLQGPLADFQGLESQMLFVRQVDHSWTFGNHHEAGMAQLFTGARFFNEATHYANGASLDQILLQETDIRGGTARASVHLTAGDRGGGDKRHVISYSGPGQPIANEPDPARAYADLFEGLTFDGSAPSTQMDTAALARREVGRRILQVNSEELRGIQRFLGQTEREKLDLHLTSLEELERRLSVVGAAPGALSAACRAIETGGIQQSLNNAETITRWAQVQADLIAAAFACDRTRIASLHFGFSGSHHEGLLGYRESWHDNVAHVSRTTDGIDVGGEMITTREAFIRFDRFWSGHIAYLARALSQIPEGDGSMLDNTLIYWGAESGTNHSHNPRDMQYLLIGGRNMGFQLGQVLEVGTRSAHQLHVSVMQGLGHTAVTGIGIEPTAGPMPGVLG